VGYKHSIFVKILSSEDFIEQLLSSTSLVFAPGLFEILQSSTPPTIAFFKSLPTNHTKQWAVYLLVLEKQSCRTKIYIGSGTSASSGVSLRFGQYEKQQLLPKYVEIDLKEGYSIVHKGLLCTTPIPSAAEVPITRLVFVALEAVFTFVFWALKCKTTFGFGFVDICPWDRDTLEYDSLCSHNPLSKSPSGDFSLSAEQLGAQAAEFAEKRRRDKRDRRAEHKNDLVAYNAKTKSTTWMLTIEAPKPSGKQKDDLQQRTWSRRNTTVKSAIMPFRERSI
jgi:hypothetical protein